MKELLLALPAGQKNPGISYGLTPAHMAYRVGSGPRLLGIRLSPALRGGAMLLDCRDFDGEGDPANCCRQILGECRRRSFQSIVCDFEGIPLGCLSRMADILDRNCAAQNLTLYVPEAFAPFVRSARILIPSVTVSGTLERRLRLAIERYGSERTVLAIEWIREDFLLPADRRGRAMTREELEGQIKRLEPAIFFDRGLCAHYYTYMVQGGQAHFVLFDTPRSIREKLSLAQRLSLPAALLAAPQVEHCLGELFGGAP